MDRILSCVLALVACAFALPAQAQLNDGALRLTIDADMLSVAKLELEQELTGVASESTVFGLGPNQVGGARSTLSAPTPIGFGVGWVLSPKFILGGRIGFGLDVQDPDGPDNSVRTLGLSLMPNLTFVPIGHKAKLFLQAYPLFQVSRAKADDRKDRYLLGGFGLGIGTFIFVVNSLSVDLGFHFEGRFGGREVDTNAGDVDFDFRDLRGLVRLGISLWR